MAKKKNTLTKLVIAGAVVIGGILVYKLVTKPAAASAPGPVTPPAGTTTNGGITSAIPSIVNLVKGIFSSSSTTTGSSTTTSGGGGNWVPASSEFGFMAGRGRGLRRL